MAYDFDPNIKLKDLQKCENFPAENFKDFLLENEFGEAFGLLENFIEFDTSPHNDEDVPKPETLAEEYFSNLNGVLFSSEINQDKLVLLKTSKNELDQLEKVGEFLNRSIEFSDLISKASDQIESLFLSKTNTEAIEAIEYFTSVYNFIPDGNISCIMNMLDLLYLDEKERSNAVIRAFENMFFKIDTKSNRTRAFHIYKNLKTILTSINYNQHPAFKILINNCVQNKIIDFDEIQLFWEIIAQKINDFSVEDRNIALHLLSIVAEAKVEIVLGNLPILESLIKQHGNTDYQLVILICSMLLQLEKVHAEKQDRPPFKYSADHSLIEVLTNLLKYGSQNRNRSSTRMMKDIIKVIYAICDQPSTICCKFLQEYYSSHIGIDDIDEDLLILFFQIVGTTAICELIYLDETVYKELKRRTHLKNLVKNKKSKKPLDTISSISSANASRSNKSRSDRDENAPLEGAEAANFEAEYILNVLDTSILNPKNFFGSILKMVQSICHNIKQYNYNPKLQISATTCFNQLLTFSSQYVEKNCALMFTLIEKVDNINMKKNIMVALLDFSVHYASVMHPWMNYIYSRLHDESVEIRKTTLFILSHLIHNDMVLVKGHIGEVALCIIDKEETVRQKAKLLFSHLAAKPNALYNVMPDVIGRLTNVSTDISEDNFKIIMKFLFDLIQKEKQMENLIEKLCSRIQASSSQRELADLSYCLFIAKYNSRSLQILLDSLPNLKDQLLDHNVYNNIKNIATTYSKSSKPEIKEVATELYNKIDKFNGSEWNENVENRENKEDESEEVEKTTPVKKINQSLDTSEVASTRKSTRTQPLRKRARK